MNPNAKGFYVHYQTVYFPNFAILALPTFSTAIAFASSRSRRLNRKERVTLNAIAIVGRATTVEREIKIMAKKLSQKYSKEDKER